MTPCNWCDGTGTTIYTPRQSGGSQEYTETCHTCGGTGEQESDDD